MVQGPVSAAIRVRLPIGLRRLVHGGEQEPGSPTYMPFGLQDALLTRVGRPRRDAMTVALGAIGAVRVRGHHAIDGALCLVALPYPGPAGNSRVPWYL